MVSIIVFEHNNLYRHIINHSKKAKEGFLKVVEGVAKTEAKKMRKIEQGPLTSVQDFTAVIKDDYRSLNVKNSQCAPTISKCLKGAIKTNVK